MINFYHQVPSVYNNASRDFQYLSWLINVVLNSVKHNVDDLYDLPNTKADPRLTELLAMTLGLRVKRNYNQQQLTALVSIIPYILKYKGTKKAIDLACIALIKASGTDGTYTIKLDDHCLEVQLPENLIDTVLFTDLLPYILPAGITARIVTKTVLDSDTAKIELDYDDAVVAAWKRDLEYDSANGRITGLSSIFEDSYFGTLDNPIMPNFANFKDMDVNKANIGLINNNIIAEVDTSIKDDTTEHLNKTEDGEE